MHDQSAIIHKLHSLFLFINIYIYIHYFLQCQAEILKTYLTQTFSSPKESFIVVTFKISISCSLISINCI